MSEQQNIQAIQNIYAAFHRGDINSILNGMTEDAEWILEAPEAIPFRGRRRGKTEVLGFFTALSTTMEDMKLTTDTWVAQGDVVATCGRYSGVVKATGKRVDVPIGHFFTMKNGKIAKFIDLFDTAAVAEAYTASSAGAGR